MSTNEEKIKNNYRNAMYEDGRAFRDKASRMEFYYTEKTIINYITEKDSVIELGCGTGYYGMFLADKCKSYMGIDITPENIDMFNNKVNEKNMTNIDTGVGDATDLYFIKDNTYDVVLVFGPMYHLPFEEREKVFMESKRICKDNGIIIYAYINKVGAYLAGCIRAPEKYPNDMANEYVLIKGMDDIRPDVFFFTMPEEMEKDAVRHQLKVIKNVGVNFSINAESINKMSEKQLKAWITLTDIMSNSPSCTGVSIHTLLVCKKE